MTNKLLLLNKIACAAALVLMMAGTASADIVFDTDFTGEEYTQNTGDIVFDDGLTLDVEDFFGSNNGIGIAGGDLSFNNSTQNRYRGTGVWLDTEDWATGPVTVNFDVANFEAGDDTDLTLEAFAANGVDGGNANTVSFDLHGAASLAGNATANGTATISSLGTQTITADGTVAFTFNFDGTDEFVGLVFSQANAANGTEFGSADLDNLTVTDSAVSVPEPSSVAFIAAGLGLVGLRRRRLK